MRAINGSDKASEARTQVNHNRLMDNVFKFTPIILPLPHVPDFSKTNTTKSIFPKFKIDKNTAYLLSLNLKQEVKLLTFIYVKLSVK